MALCDAASRVDTAANAELYSIRSEMVCVRTLVRALLSALRFAESGAQSETRASLDSTRLDLSVR